MEKKNVLWVDLNITRATGGAERTAAIEMIDPQKGKGIKPKTLGADKGYDTKDFVKNLCERKVPAHVAANTECRGGSAIDGRTTRHEGYAVSKRKRKRVKE